MDERTIGIVGAGISGLLACKYAISKGLRPVVFEADEGLGGVWKSTTIESTKLQSPRPTFEFSDFPWPSSVHEMFPSHDQVLDYLESYAKRFGLLGSIEFNSKVVGLEYVLESGDQDEEEIIMESWDKWGGMGKPFESNGKWHVLVQDTKTSLTKVHKFEFLILCIGRFSGVPNIPKFPKNEGPEVFKGEVIHSIDYSAMKNEKANEFIKGKRIVVVGSQKSAIDIAAQCARVNGVENPCHMIQRTNHWQLPSLNIWGVNYGLLYFTRLSELSIHKPGESFLLSILASLLSPLRWGVSKFCESYLKWKLPLKKYGVVPKSSFVQDFSSCQITMLPEDFYGYVDRGSIILKNSQSFGFCEKGLVIGGEDQPLKTDVVILATGYRGDKKLQSIFKSSKFQNLILGPQGRSAPLYRQVIHPRIPQLAVIGFAESLSNLFTSEIRCQWLAHFLSGGFELPSIRDMENDVKMWENSLKLCGGMGSCNASLHFWYNDQICKDMGSNPRRKKGILAEWFMPYMPSDYANLAKD